MIPKPLATAIIVVVTVVWAINFAAQFIVEDYSPDVAINGIFMAIVGGALALSRRSNKDKNGNPEEDKEEEDPEPAKVD
ncbi:MAG: hypothetical protein WC054_01065 [Candidatus Nanopelagicales bacterium]